MSVDHEYRIRNVTAVLGPTNTGKTHLAIERMLAHESGMIGLPLRLLAREVYDKIVARIGAEKVALITGEEKIKPDTARYWVCTVEAMPPDIQTDFLAIDEIQLAADPERGHVFTDRLLHARGKSETLLLGAATMRDCIDDLVPGANFITRPRLSKLSYAGEKKITRLPPRTAVVTFSANDVYAIAELMRRQRGGAAVVLGALSPRTRNAQVALFQNGDVDFLIATDAIGMGLNLDVEHVALAQTRKFDGMTHRELTPAELAQIAGRAGRHMKDGSFGVTGGIEPFQPDLIERLENHQFDPIKVLQWRGREMDFTTVEHLRASLRALPNEQRLQKARMADDVMALEALAGDSDITDLAKGRKAVELLWEICQVPDYRKISTQSHAELVGTLYKSLMTGSHRINEDWFAAQVANCDKTEGDIDTLSQRLAHIRTWTFVANRPNWLADVAGWQDKTRAIEDKLSDALHEQLTLRFVDRKASALMRGMRDKDEMYAEIADDGAVNVEKHFVGRLKGFRFQPETQSDDAQGKAARAAASHVLAKELVMRARRVSSAKSDAFKINRQGEILWRGDAIAHLTKGDAPLKPLVVLDADEHLSGPDKEKVQERLNAWITELIGDRLKPLVEIAAAEDISGLARGIAFRMTETFGVLRRETAAEELKTLDQASRSSLRKYGVRFGAFNVFFPLLLKPAAAELALILRVLNGGAPGLSLDALPEPPKAGLTSIPVNPAVPETYYNTLGYQVCGPRAVRIDMLERLADMIRPLLAFRAEAAAPGTKTPTGSTGDGGFIVTPTMMSILGCSSAELGNVISTLGFRVEKKPAKSAIKSAPPAPPVDPAAPTAPATTEAAAIADTGAPVEPVEGEAALEAAPAIADAEQLEPTAVEPPVAEAAPLAEATAEPAQTAPVDAAATAPEASATETPEAATPVASPAEEATIDVWRPRRRFQERRPAHRQGDRQNDRQGERRAEGGDANGDRRPFNRNNNRRGNDNRRNDRGPSAPAAGADGIAAAAANGAPDAAAAPADATQHQRRDGRPQGDRPSNDRPWRDRNASGGDRRDGPKRDGDKREGGRPPFDARKGPPRDRDGRPGGRPGGDRGGDRGDRRGGGRKPEQYSSGPSKSAGPDPNSPFAALMALKANLDKGGKD